MAATNLLGQEENPLTADEWQRLNETVTAVARRQLVGRRFMDLYGPLGAGVQTVPYDEYKGLAPALADLGGRHETESILTDARHFKSIPILYKDFLLHNRDIQAAHEHKLPLDLSAAAGAAALCAAREDELIFYGHATLGIEGLVNVKGRTVVPQSDWNQAGNGFGDVVRATQRLNELGHYGPYALVVSPKLYASLHRIYEKTGVLEIETLRQLASEGVFQSSQLKEDAAVVISTGRENLDLAVAMDMRVAYLGPQQMNHPYRVLEMVLPRIKHPDAICTLEKG